MARPLRMEYAGAVYHVMARGQERGAIFRADEDRDGFLEELGEAVGERRWVLHGYCLMTNHYHLLVETPEANLSSGMQLLNGRYSQSFNSQRRRRGHLFEDRYKSVVVEKESYLLELCRYLVLNPVRAGMVRAAREWRWSNYRATAGEAARPTFLEVNWTLSQFGTDGGKARESYRRFVAEGRGKASPMEQVTGQVFLGGPAFVAEMRRRLEEESGELSKAIPRAQREAGFLDVEEVVAAVAEDYGLPRDALGEAWRRGEERAVAVYLSRRLTGASGVKLGERFGITSARVSQLSKGIDETGDATLRRRVARLEEKLRRGRA